MTTLLEDIKAYYEQSNYPPDGDDLDYDVVDGQGNTKDARTELVSEEDLDEARWGTWFVNVYQRGNEFVAVHDCRPATEMQDWGDYGSPEIYEVVPRTEVVTKIFYDKVQGRHEGDSL